MTPVRHGLSAVYVEKLDSRQTVAHPFHVSAAVPRLYCTAVGEVVLAHMRDDEAEKNSTRSWDWKERLQRQGR